MTFESTLPWEASVAETRSVSWLSIEPVSGPAGSNTITITLQPNPGEDSRTAVITIQAGSEKATITVTQTGTGEPSDPGPGTVTSENLLAQIDWESTWEEPASEWAPAQTTHDRGILRFEYDAQNRPIFFGEYDFYNETDKLGFYSEHKFDRSQKNRIVESERYFEYDSRQSGSYPIAYRRDQYKEEEIYELDDNGRLIKRTSKGEDDSMADTHYVYSYNADGTLAGYVCDDPTSTDTESYEWKDGNIAAAVRNKDSRTEYTYTEYPNTWCGIDISMALDDVTMGYALGILGVRTKNLLASSADSYGNTTDYSYTFDEKGRIATMTYVYRETRSDGTATSTGTTVYTFRYGPTPKPVYEEAIHMTRQEVVDGGTRDAAAGDSYVSYVKIRSHFSDGTTKEDETTQEGRIEMEYESIPYRTIPAGATVPAAAPSSVTLETAASEYGHRMDCLCTLHYTYFDIPTKWAVYFPVCRLYMGYEKGKQDYLMPTRPVTKETFVCDTPTITANGDGTYQFEQHIRAQLTLGASASVHSVDCQLVPAAE